jgi:hypothetical protein
MGYETRIIEIVQNDNSRMGNYLGQCTVTATQLNDIDIECPTDFIREQLQIYFDTSCPWQLQNATFNIHV